ncbi:MAG: hypothetical protein ABIJ45_01990 [Candidatus Zixiibacteriota bacterium]
MSITQFNFKTFIHFLTFIILLISPIAVFSENIELKPFVDIDGDGFDDNIADDDGDAIPNTADPDFMEVPEPQNESSNFINFSGALEAAGRTVDLSENSDKFGELSFNTRALTKNRCAFTSEDGFGGEGVSVGAGGGACAGGVCR